MLVGISQKAKVLAPTLALLHNQMYKMQSSLLR
jgi:hypothetical protein